MGASQIDWVSIHIGMGSIRSRSRIDLGSTSSLRSLRGRLRFDPKQIDPEMIRISIRIPRQSAADQGYFEVDPGSIRDRSISTWDRSGSIRICPVAIDLIDVGSTRDRSWTISGPPRLDPGPTRSRQCGRLGIEQGSIRIGCRSGIDPGLAKDRASGRPGNDRGSIKIRDTAGNDLDRQGVDEHRPGFDMDRPGVDQGSTRGRSGIDRQSVVDLNSTGDRSGIDGGST